MIEWMLKTYRTGISRICENEISGVCVMCNDCRTSCHLDAVASNTSDSVVYNSLPNGPVWWSCRWCWLLVPSRRHHSLQILPSLMPRVSRFMSSSLLSALLAICLSLCNQISHVILWLSYLLYLFSFTKFMTAWILMSGAQFTNDLRTIFGLKISFQQLFNWQNI